VSIRVDEYGERSGETIHRITLESERLRAVLLDDGARLLELHAPDRNGEHSDLVLGYPDAGAHERGTAYFGATCGRCANRIRRGTFTLDDEVMSVATNEGPNHLHGGTVGFDRHRWSWNVDEGRNAVIFSLSSPDGDQGYPGALDTTTEYVLGDATLDIRMTAVTSKPTIVNMVHHSYWNLRGHDQGDVLGHRLRVESDFFTPVDDELIPTGEILSVGGTPFDFTEPTEIGSSVREVEHGGAGRDTPAGFAGYDHNWVVRGQVGAMRPCATVHEPTTGRRLSLSTNEAGVQIYTGGYLDGIEGKNGATYMPFQGLTLETQRFPDAPNHGHFPTAVLRPGQRYDHRMNLEFSTD
jgi:aldose 1-epimerase